MLPRIGDRRRATNELWLAAIKIRNAPQTSQNIAKMAAKYATVGVQLIKHDISQIFKEPRPSRVMRKNPSVQHVRIGQYDMAFFAYSFARVAGRVTVVGEDPKLVFEPLIQIMNFS